MLNEDESDKYTHVGYGRYKEKGKEDDEDAQTFQKTDSGKFEPIGGEKGKDDKPEPKQTQIVVDPFADKDSKVDEPTTEPDSKTDDFKDVKHQRLGIDVNLFDDFAKKDAEKYPNVKEIGKFSDPRTNKVIYYAKKIRDAKPMGYRDSEIRDAIRDIETYDFKFNTSDDQFRTLKDFISGYRDYAPGGSLYKGELKKEFKQYDFIKKFNNWR